jgi:SEC-C motif
VSKIKRNCLCPCGSGKKYKKCHGSIKPVPELSRDPQVACICGSDLHPYDCCGSYLASSQRLSPSIKNSQFFVKNNRYSKEYRGKIYFCILSTETKYWKIFRSFYVYGLEINGRFFRPKTLDFVLEMQSDNYTIWQIKCNLDYYTGAIINLKSSNKLPRDEIQIEECNISISEPIYKIEVPNIRIIENRYLRLFHHTSIKGNSGIISSKEFWPSPYDLQGSKRQLKRVNFGYFTDIPELKYESDLFNVAMREKGRAVFRTDDESQFEYVDIYAQPSYKRERRLIFYIDIKMLVPVPAIYHEQDGNQFIEFFHPHIFRIAVKPDTNLPIEQYEDGWKLNSTISLHKVNQFPIANGNNLFELGYIYLDKYIEQ